MKKKGPSQQLTIGRIVRTEVAGEEFPAIVVKVHSESVVDLIAFTSAGEVQRHLVRLRGVESPETVTWWWPQGPGFQA